MIQIGIHDLRKVLTRPVKICGVIETGDITINSEFPAVMDVNLVAQAAPVEVTSAPFNAAEPIPFTYDGAADKSIAAGAMYGFIQHTSETGTREYIDIVQGTQLLRRLYLGEVYPIKGKTDFADKKEYRSSALTVTAYGNNYTIDLKYPSAT